ncbi:MAG TPA: bile acid:sodium symporter [Candidatus Cybelea sp.]|jgi:BASS family bile acid:Na+ symporter
MTLLKIVPIVLLVSLTFTAGLLVNLAALRDTIKRVGVLLRALIANFVIVPALALVITRAYHLPDPIATGVLLMAMAPGVPFIMLAGGRQKGGSLELAIEVTFIMAALSTITIPFTARLLLREASGARVPLEQLVALGLFQLLPLIVGALLAARRPAIALAITPFFKRLTMIGAIALLAIVMPQIVRSVAIVYGTLGTLAMLTIVILSLATGWLAGGRRAEYRHTLAIGTALRNPGSAAVIASLFKSPTVEAAVATYLIVQFVVAAVAGEFFKRFPQNQV